MVNIEIVEGIKQAVSRGESLNKAIQSFLNAGYPREEVEESAEYLKMPPAYNQVQNLPTQQQSYSQPVQQIQQNTEKQINPQIKKEGVSMIMIIILGVILLVLVGALIGAIFFKDRIINFFNGI